MSDRSARAFRDIPTLRKWLDRLLIVSKDCFTPTPSLGSDDHLGFMALSFAYKQNEHGRSVMQLGDSLDAVLIVRSMLEGLTQLLWAAREPDGRPLLWRTYSCVLDWRRLQDADAQGKPVAAEDRDHVTWCIKEYGPRFYTKKARIAQQAGGALPADPYRDSWSGRTQKDMFEEVKAALHYTAIYRPFSEWHHWSPGGLGARITETADGYAFSTVSPTDTASALSVAFLCLWQTMEVTDAHLSLGQAKALIEVKDGYIRDLGSGTAPA